MPIIYERPGMFDRLGQGVGGMFEGLRGWSQPRSNRLMLTGMGLLSGKSGPEGWEGAMKGLVAGSALDTENKRERALSGLMSDPDSVFAGLSESDRAYIASDPEMAQAAMAARLKPADTPGSWDEYVRTTSNPTEAGYDAFLRRPARSGVTINTGGNLPTGYRFTDPNDPSAGATRIEGVLGNEAEQKSRALLTMVEPDYQTALSTFGALSNPADLAASYGGDIGRYFQSADYQVATDAITNIAQSYLYSASGQAAPDAEVRRMAGLVTPTLTDRPEAIAMKKKRLGSMVEAIRQKSGTPALVSPDDPAGLRN